MLRHYGLEIVLPGGKPLENEAAVVRLVAQRAALFDRLNELLVFASPEDAASAREALDRCRVPAEPLELALLPDDDRLRRGPLYEDYVLVTERGRTYAVAGETAMLRLTAEGPEAEPAPALLQLEENRIATVCDDNGYEWLVVASGEAEWAERVARAYRCGIVWLA